MKKIILSFACAGLLASSALAVRVDPKALRSYGDTAPNGQAWSVGALSFDTVCEDAGLAAGTIQGAGYIGGLSTLLGSATNVIRQMGAIALFDAGELAAAGNHYELVLEAPDNLGLSFQLNVAVVDDRSTRAIFTGTGPFAGSFTTYHVGSISGNANDGINAIGGSTGATRYPDTIVPEIRIGLGGGGGGTLSGCLNGSGQFRVLDPDNNANWREDCSAGGWRPVEVGVGGGGLDLTDAIGGASLDTCSYSCTGPTVPCVAADGSTGTPDLTIENPIAIAISSAGEQSDRWSTFVSTSGFLAGQNLLVVGGDPTEPSSLYIDAN